MRYFSQKDWDEYQAARKTPARERDFVKELDYESGRVTLRQAGIEILPSCPSSDLIISRRPWIKNFTGVVIQPEDAIAMYKHMDLSSSYPGAMDNLMGDPLEDVKNLLNAVFGEGKDGRD